MKRKIHSVFTQQSTKKESKIQEFGYQRQHIVDDALISSFKGDAELRLHQPVTNEIVMTNDKQGKRDIPIQSSYLKMEIFTTLILGNGTGFYYKQRMRN